MSPIGQFNVLIVPLQKFLAKVTPRLSVSEPVYGNKDTVERLIESHQVSIVVECLTFEQNGPKLQHGINHYNTHSMMRS